MGYIHGVAVFLIIGQLEKLFGLDIEAADPIPQLLEVGREVSRAPSTTLVVGIACLAPLLVIRWLAPNSPARCSVGARRPTMPFWDGSSDWAVMRT